MDIVFEITLDMLIDIISFCISNKNNNVLSNMFVEIKNDMKNSHYYLLNDYQKDLLNLSFLKSAKSHKVIYNKKYNVFIKDYVFDNSTVLILSIVNMDNIKTFVLFNEKYITYQFKQFLFESESIQKDLFSYCKYESIPIAKRLENTLYYRQKESLIFKDRKKDKQIKLRNKLNKKYGYLKESERKFLNKRDKQKGTLNNESYMTFMESLESMESELESLEQELESIDDMKEYYQVINQIDLLKYDIQERKNILNKDIKENIFYSNINY